MHFTHAEALSKKTPQSALHLVENEAAGEFHELNMNIGEVQLKTPASLTAYVTCNE